MLFPIIGTCALANFQGPGGMRGFYSSWTGIFGAFDPKSLPNLILWLDGNDSSTLYDATTGGSLVTNNGFVARWEDKSTNLAHFTQSTSANRPQRKTAERNGNDIVRFDGTNDVLSLPATNITFLSTNQPMTLYVVTSYDSPNNLYPTVLTLANNAGANQGWALFGSIVGGYQYHAFGSGGAWLRKRFGSATAFGSYWNYRFIYSGSSFNTTNGWSVYLNNALQALSDTSSYAAQSQDNNVIGAAGANYLRGNVCEILIYRAQHTDSQQAQVNTYLTTKWGF